MKIIKKLFILIFLFIMLITTYFIYSGYNYYLKAINEYSLEYRVSKIVNNDNYTPFDELSQDYINAVIAVEDHRYFSHGPVDFIGLCRALYTNIKSKELREGGSTITQQVAKNVILKQEKSLDRKIAEIFASYDIEKHYSKNEIFALYVNSSYFGDGYYCIKDACKGYFNKLPKDLNLNESSMLAGIPNAPSLYSPTVNINLCQKRQRHVLNKMVEHNYISQDKMNSIFNS